MKAIADLQMRVEEISGELDEIRENFSEEESEAYLDSEKENAFDKKAITAGAKAKKDEVEAETKEKLKKIVKLWEEQKNKNKQIKEAKQTLIDKTVKAIENLSDEIFLYSYIKNGLILLFMVLMKRSLRSYLLLKIKCVH